MAIPVYDDSSDPDDSDGNVIIERSGRAIIRFEPLASWSHVNQNGRTVSEECGKVKCPFCKLSEIPVIAEVDSWTRSICVSCGGDLMLQSTTSRQLAYERAVRRIA